MLVESSICRFNHVSVVLIKTVIFFIFLDLTKTRPHQARWNCFRAQMNAFNIITVIIIHITV